MNLSALDEKGNPVDWWFLYKVPQLAKGASTAAAQGYEYVYFDEHQSQVVQSPNLLTGGKGALASTLSALLQKPEATTGWILYNDEMPASANRSDSSSLGHTKGVIGFDVASNTAFWLLHSWPKYVDPGAAAMPTPIYGQTFLCLSLDLASASKLAAQMANYQEPQVYLPRVATIAKTDPLYVLTQALNTSVPGDSNVLSLTTAGGLPFKVIAKNRKWGKDFWNDLVGPSLGADMDVETWIRGAIPPVIDSDGVHHIYDVKYIDLRPLGAPWAWPETHDHAKWGITTAANWICVGDINRMVSQENRGGGTIAFQNATLWQALSKTDLLVPPPGGTRAEALALIKATHPKRPVKPPAHTLPPSP